MSEIVQEVRKSKAAGAEEITIVKANGQRETFDPEKLKASLYHSGAAEEAIEQVMTHVLPELHDGMSTHDIYRHAFLVLQGISRPVARSYSLRRAVMDLGPSGFPFEDFVAEILRAKGFQCLTRQTVLGGCVSHEVDVVAYNDVKLMMVEAKFHNELGTKSDLKVVLYIKARFDDLKENVFDYGGKNRPITDSWLITNTKFTSTAIHYGLCQNLTMIGWNYPEKGSLQDMIEEERLHPITCLTTLSESEKNQLLSGGVALCSSVKSNPKILSTILGVNFGSQAVLNEINEL
ncbi:MAG: ATPase [Candidatus Zambryskibacteria bacterium]|nr:ATPase [Candidatus Zambryskibacteria bacterium]